MQRRTFLAAGLASSLTPGLVRGSVEVNGRLLVVDSVGSALLAYDNRTYARLGRVPLAHRPREIAISPKGETAYVAIYGTGVYGNNPNPGREIVAINTKTLRVEKRISLAPFFGPHGLVVAPDGHLWVTCETEGALLVVDPAASKRSKAVSAVVPLGVKGPHWVAMTPDGQTVYATNRTNSVLSVVDAMERRLIQEIKMPRGLEGLAIAPDGRRLFAADLTRASLWVIDVAESRPVKEHALDEPATRVHAIPDGSGLMLAHEQSGTLEVLEVPTLRRRGVARIGKAPAGMTTSTDGRIGYVASWGGGTISIVDLESLRVLRTLETGGGPDGLIYVGSASL